jgi:nucleotide-binding universal stress UspA family protein
VEWAAREAVLHGVPLRIVSATSLPKMVVLPLQPKHDAVLDFVRDYRDLALAAATARAAEVAPGLLIDTHPVEGPPAQAVTASGAGALMLVTSSRGIGAFTAIVPGSVAQYAADHARCPVVVVRGETAAAVHRLVGVGLGDLDNCAGTLAFASEEAALRKAKLLAIHAWHAPQDGIFWAGHRFPAPRPACRGSTCRPAADAAAGRLAREVPRHPGEQGCRARSPRPGASQPVGPRRPGGHRQARQPLRPAGPRLGPACPAEPRPRPHSRRPVILTARSQVPLGPPLGTFAL